MTRGAAPAALGVFSLLPVSAHEGHDEAEPHTPSQAQPQAGAQVLEASSAQFEAVLKFPPLTLGREQTLKLFLSDYATNAPVTGAQVEGLLGEKYTIAFKPVRPGIYEAHVSFTEAGPIDAGLSITAGNRQDLLVLEGLPVGGVKEKAESPFWLQPTYFVPALGLLGLLLLGIWLRRKKHV